MATSDSGEGTKVVKRCHCGRSGSRHAKALRRNRVSLVQNVDLDNSLLLDELMSKEIVSRKLKDKIDGEPVPSNRTSILLDHLEKRPQTDFNAFLEALQNNHQHFIADALIKDWEACSSEDDCESKTSEDCQVSPEVCCRCVQNLTVHSVNTMHIHHHGTFSLQSGSTDHVTFTPDCHCSNSRHATFDRGPLNRTASSPEQHGDNITSLEETTETLAGTASSAEGILRPTEGILNIDVTANSGDIPTYTLTAGSHTVDVSARSEDVFNAWIQTLASAKKIVFHHNPMARDSGQHERDSGRYSGVPEMEESP